MKNRLNLKLILLLTIVATAIFFRFYGLERHDVLTDEASISFRSIGYLDFLATPYQTTPLEWLNFKPWWFNLSFHDHPFLNFLIQHIFFKLFGVSTYTMRALPALFGVLSVILIYFLGKRIFNDKLGIAASALLAVNVHHIWISRLALQESAAIFFVLLSLLIFLKALENKKYFYWFGITAGAALLIKLHAVIIFPLVVSYLLIFRPPAWTWKQKEVYLSFLITAVVFSPYLLYNFLLYKTFGHFDYQLSYLFKQYVDKWQIRPGRFEFPTLSSSLKYFFLNLKDNFSPLFLIGSGSGFVFLALALIKKKLGELKNKVAWVLTIIMLYFLLLLFIGPSQRFLSLIAPWLAILLAFTALWLSQRRFKTTVVILIFFLGFEAFFSYNTAISLEKRGIENLTYSKSKIHAFAYGYNSLEPFVAEVTRGKKPKVILPINNNNLAKIVEENAKKQPGKPAAIMFIHDPRLYGESVLWILTRRMIYEGWPVLSYDVYKETLRNLGENFFREMGITEFYYIAPTKNLPLQPNLIVTSSDEELRQFENKLRNRLTATLKNPFGQEVFRIYKFN